MMDVILDPGGRHVDLAPGQTPMEAGRQLTERGQIGIESPCGGKGRCGQCRVIVRTGEVSPPNSTEKAFILPADLDQGVRLACQCVALGPVRAEIPPETMAAVPDLQITGGVAQVAIDPPVRRLAVRLRPVAPPPFQCGGSSKRNWPFPTGCAN